MDEKWCRLTIHHQQSVLAQKGTKHVHLVSPEHAENVTIVGCCNAIGNSIPPMIIFKGKRLKPELADNLPPGSIVGMAPRGSMTTELFIEFVRHLARYKGLYTILLVFDGAACHLDYDIVEAADEHNIKLFCLPSNTTHELQPLDKSVYRSFESHWDQELFRFWDHHPDRMLTKIRFNERISSTDLGQQDIEWIQSYPFNPEIIPEHAFAPSIPTERPAPAEQDQNMAALGSTNLNDSLDASDDGFSDENLIPLIQLSSQQHIIENETVELEELAPDAQAEDGE
ncbi:hypothetical protein NQ318_005955 [Aromia moschata]|uniref:DDE-1 domain-containing protein n=1 Tax=Aromia moschata TaxID=1265417 RepID=A0AAV8YEP2_9CUCU|nr:hypothetical protein NQ318_005955 [Aromia moschata]